MFRFGRKGIVVAGAVSVLLAFGPTYAEDLVVDGSILQNVTPEEIKNIEGILGASKLVSPGTKIVAGSTPKFIPGIPGLDAICRAACDAAAAVAAGSCSGSAAAVALCLVAVEAGRQECRSRC